MKHRSPSELARHRQRILTSGLICMTYLAGCASPSVRGELQQDVVTVALSDSAFATVHLGALPKPFVFPLYGPGAVPVTRGYPMLPGPADEQDHPHHQSLWFAHGDVNGYDFWHGTEHNERIVWDGDLTVENESDRCRVLASYNWMANEDTLVCMEERELIFSESEDERTVDIQITLTPGSQALVMGDTKEGSFALRIHPALRVTGKAANGHLMNSEGQSGSDVWGKRARWIDDSGHVDNVPVGIAIFDHPENPRHPTWWHARTYGLLAANPFGVHDFEGKPEGAGQMTIPVGSRLQLRYRVLLHGADWDAARIDEAYGEWITE